jgi:hypothetical protein
MEGEIESAHVYARINERYCAMQGWSSVNIRLDPYSAQVKEQPSQHEQIRDAIFRLKYGPQWQPSDSFDANGALLAPSADEADLGRPTVEFTMFGGACPIPHKPA